MPTYVYQCDVCDTKFEAVQKFSDLPLKVCPEGHEGIRRVITPSAIIFKGSGWYITDSKSGSKSTVPGKSSEGGDKPDTKADATADGAKIDKSETTKSESTAKPESKKPTEVA